MSTHIGDTELRLLASLHERSDGSGQRIGLDPRAVVKSLRLGAAQFASGSSALAGYDLAGVRRFRSDSRDHHVAVGPFAAIWLTGRGEDYLRRLEADPRVGRRVTLDMATRMAGALTAIATAVLVEF